MGFVAPPRRVRLRAAAAWWWPLGLTAGAMLVMLTATILVILATEGFRLPFADWRLDREAAVSARTARVLAVRETAGHFGAEVVYQVEYSFDRGDGTVHTGTCYTLGRRYEPGKEVAVEYLAEDPSLLRLRHSALAESALWAPLLLPFWLGALVLTAFWGCGVYRLRVLLRQGNAVAATLVEARPLRWVNPDQLQVRYEYTAAGERHQGRQWLRRSGAFARRLQALPAGEPIPGAAAVYDEARPARSRLLADEDAAPAA